MPHGNYEEVLPFSPPPVRKIPSQRYTLDVCLNFQLDLLRFSPAMRFVISAFIVLGVFIPYAWLQEYLMSVHSDLEERPQGLGAFLTFATFMFWALFSFVEGAWVGDFISPHAPFSRYLVLATLSTISMSVSNIALQFVNYPTKVIFKTSKTIPVMCAGYVWFRKKYQVAEYLAALCIITSVVWFSYGNMIVAPTFSFIGYMLMTFGLLSDSLCQNLTEKTLTESECSEREMIFYNSALGSLYLWVYLVFWLESLWNCLTFFSFWSWILIFLFAWLSFVGNKVLLTITRVNGVFISLFLTSVRKILTILFSFVFFPKPFTYHYLFAGLVALIGISLNIWVQSEKHAKRKTPFYHEKSSSI